MEYILLIPQSVLIALPKPIRKFMYLLEAQIKQIHIGGIPVPADTRLIFFLALKSLRAPQHSNTVRMSSSRGPLSWAVTQRRQSPSVTGVTFPRIGRVGGIEAYKSTEQD